ncbi:hypothetical protein KFL_007030050 [Klebsormidium nitens]|uniref:HIT-type domain-containing protein n=1 Tax=Klebsormidium nitens TaxID=105231 RepID=A0A1Y1ILC1_KLENI|nr:hypothetical protein KFL_007030050 [Klebsormidium nitens]|eukprot:GAQ90932.1 hypothetical protein KFL_007030050 [Klebsormidium nitens]
MAGEGNVLIQPQGDNAGAPDVRIICRVCQKQWSKYACPRCNVRYCSLPCYKAHSSRCTEGFYRENAESELRQRKADPEERRKMLQTLKRMQEAEGAEGLDDLGLEGGFNLAEGEGGGDSDTEEEEEMEEGGGFELSEETLRRLSDKGSDLSLDDLTSTERASLRQAAASGALSRFITPCEPWYLSPEAKQIRISPTGTRPVREILVTGGAIHTSAKTRAEEAFEKLTGAPASGVSRGEGVTKAAERNGSSNSMQVERGSCGDVSREDKQFGPEAADVSGESFMPARGGASRSASGHPLQGDVDTTHADVSMVGADESAEDADVSTEREDVSEEEARPSIPPPLEEDLPPLAALTKSPPSPLLGFHLTSVLYAYSYVLRLFNGDWAADPLDAAGILVEVSPVLSDGAMPASGEDALHGCLERACSPSLAGHGGRAFARGLLGDVNALLSLGRPGVVCALADVQRMLLAAQGERQLAGSTGAGGAAQLTARGGNRGKTGGKPEGASEGGGKLEGVSGESGAPGKSSASTSKAKAGQKIQGVKGSSQGRGGSGKSGDSSRGTSYKKGGAKRQPELVRRKVFFFLVWANEQPDPVFCALAAAASEMWEGEKARSEAEQRDQNGAQKSGIIEEL